MSHQNHTIAIVVLLAAGSLRTSDVSAKESRVVRFDLPPVAAAYPAELDPSDPTLVTVQLRLSSMIESPEVPRIDQWVVRCQPRDRAILIADYAPRTETASDLASAIQIKTTREQTDAVGLSLDGAYAHALRGKAGADYSKKNVRSVQFDRIAQQQAVTASGTINRGRGVYFKLRWTAQQVLEGEKLFNVTLKVPQSWRGSLIDVSVVAQSERKTLAGWDHETKTIGSAFFVVAAYRQGDHEAEAQAIAISDAEYTLRSIAAEHRASTQVNSLPSMLRHVAMKLDLEPSRDDFDWLHRLILDRADPHLDDEIRKLPMPTRVAVLDYVDVREDFATFSGDAPERVVVAKPAP